jgi:hypothetical protein
MKKIFPSGHFSLVIFALLSILIGGPKVILADTVSFPVQADGWTEKSGFDWNIVHSSLNGDLAFSDGNNGYEDRIGGFQWFVNYYIRRLHLTFDTTLLPPNAIIDIAKIIINFDPENRILDASTTLFM